MSPAPLVAWSVGGAAMAGVVACALIARRRRSSLALEATVVALAPLVAVGAGVVGASRAMFLSSSDLAALLVVMAGAGTVGVAVALVLGRRLAAAAGSLEVLASGLGSESGSSPLDRQPTRSQGSPIRAPDELVRLADQLEATRSRLEDSRRQTAAVETSRRELVAWVSHDLRTPLAGIRAMIEALEDGLVTDGDTVSRYYRTIRSESDRLSGLVDDLFELSRIHSGVLRLSPEPTALDEILSDALAGATPVAQAKGVHLHGRVSDPVPVARIGIPEMTRVVRNLLDNAIRHTPVGGTVSLEASIDSEAHQAVVWVDDGCGGIPDGDLSRVFDVAFRGDPARTPSGRGAIATSGTGDNGAGLGLAIARGLVEALQGTIRVENRKGGCRFLVALPAAVGAVARPSGAPAPAGGPR
ncbi:MAG: sensor histidine kinase [Acidimicrobiales bacterium]